jgi:hypothetical protein
VSQEVTSRVSLHDEEVYRSEALRNQEELSMTLCILAFASDGWIMAADRREHNQLGSTWNATPLLDTAMKICWDKEAGVAACFSGDIVARKIAEGLVAAIRGNKFEQVPNEHDRRESIKAMANDIFREVKSQWADRLSSCERTILVVFPSGETWRIAGWDGVGATRISQKRGAICIGDIPNPAVYLTQRFYPSSGELKTVADLQFLIAHCILEAGILNPTGVQELDLLTFKKTANQAEKFLFYQQPELDLLAAKSIDKFKEISKLLFPE